VELSKKTILITGASSGLGRALAVALSRDDNRLIITARRAERLEALAEEVRANGSKCVVCPADATDAAAVAKVIETGKAELGDIDVAVINAGGGKATRMGEASVDDVVGMMRTNYDTLVHFLVPMIEEMRERGGVIAHTSSPAGFFGLPMSGPYSASKAAGRMLFDTCRIELAATKIRFVALYPGFTATEGLDPNDVPVKSLIITTERATKEIIRAIRTERSHTMFPKRIRFLMAVARLLPEPVRRRVLALGG